MERSSSGSAAAAYLRGPIASEGNMGIWPFNRGQSTSKPLLVVRVDDAVVCAIHRADVPAERRCDVELTRAGQTLQFVNSAGGARSYDLPLVYEEGTRFLHLSLRVGPTFTVQPDALLTADGKNPEEVFKSPRGKGLRFQPFYLPECSGKPTDLVGRGLFYRGLHYPGVITRGNVSLICACDHCRRTFRLQSFHAGFGQQSYFYCSRGLHTLVTSAYLEDAPAVLAKPNPAALARFEQRLPSCTTCGGDFRYMNPLRCPHCHEPYIDFHRHPGTREQEYYGNHLYGEGAQTWAPEN
jgi:hypothetical protein